MSPIARRAARGLLVAALAVSLGACPRKGPGAGGPAAFDGRAGVPADALAVARVDAATLLARPGLKEVGALVQKLTARLQQALGLDFALLRDAVVYYAPSASGGFSRRGAALIPQSLRGSPGLGALGAPVDLGGRPGHALGTTATVSFVEGGTVVGDARSVTHSLQALAGQRPALARDDALWRAVDAVGNQPFRLGVRLGGLGRLLARLPVPGLSSVQTAAFGGDVVGTDLTLDVALVTTDAVALAGALKQMVGTLAAKLSASVIFKMFADLLAGVQVRAEGDRVLVSARLPLGIVQTFLPILLGTLGGE